MTPKNLKEIEERELIPGYSVRFIHSQKVTIAYWNIKADASMPEHSHHHEQVVNMIEGRFELTVDGKPYVMGPGDVLVIPPNIKHSGRSIEHCRIIDVFCPVREDYVR